MNNGIRLVGVVLLLVAFGIVRGIVASSARDGSTLAGVLAGNGFQAIVWALAAAAWALIATARGPRRVAAAIALVVAPVVWHVAASGWGEARVASFEAGRAPRVLAEKERLAREPRPVVRGRATEEDAALLYERAASIAALPPQEPAGLHSAVHATTLAPVSSELRAEVARCGSALALLRDATHATRYVPRIDRRLGVTLEGPWPDTSKVARLAARLAIDARARALDGAPEEAIERLLEIVRVGSDQARGPGLDLVFGARTALVGIDGLVPIALLPGVDRVALARDLELLERDFPTAATNARLTRLEEMGNVRFWAMGAWLWPGLIETGERDGPWQLDASLVAAWQPFVYVTARRLPEVDAFLAQLEAEPPLGDRATCEALDERLAAGARRFGDTVSGSVKTAVKVFQCARVAAFEVRARTRLLRLALAVEAERACTGLVPAEASFTDPFGSPADLRYEASGETFRAWSRGRNGRDDGGTCERRTPRDDPSIASDGVALVATW